MRVPHLTAAAAAYEPCSTAAAAAAATAATTAAAAAASLRVAAVKVINTWLVAHGEVAEYRTHQALSVTHQHVVSSMG